MFIDLKRTGFWLCDLQAKFMPTLPEANRQNVVGNCRKLLRVADLLKIPITVSEQNPTST